MKCQIFKAITTIVVALPALVTPIASVAQTACAPRTQVLERLSVKYGETRQSIGLGANNAVVEVFASSESGSWTITVTNTSGMTCMIASGQAFETLAEALAKPQEDA